MFRNLTFPLIGFLKKVSPIAWPSFIPIPECGFFSPEKKEDFTRQLMLMAIGIFLVQIPGRGLSRNIYQLFIFGRGAPLFPWFRLFYIISIGIIIYFYCPVFML
jgi:hypothetical protein